jgi:hypothetical protein
MPCPNVLWIWLDIAFPSLAGKERDFRWRRIPLQGQSEQVIRTKHGEKGVFNVLTPLYGHNTFGYFLSDEGEPDNEKH